MAAVELYPDRPMTADEMKRIHRANDGFLTSTWRLEVDSSVTRVYEVDAVTEQEAWDIYRDNDGRVREVTEHTWPEETAWRAKVVG